MFKYRVLDHFVEKYRDLPVQGTDAWKLSRKGFIGGSEVATILKQNKYKSVGKLVLEKLGFDKFTGNAITCWGNVFEEVIRQHCEEVFSCKIRETGSIPYCKDMLSYSPDGLAVVPTTRLADAAGPLPDNLDASCPAQLVLFEFKCPHSRVATCEIPPYYLPQVSIGMNIIDIMEVAVFVQATFRRCSFDQLRHNTLHNPYGHYKKADTSKSPIGYGFMIIHADRDDEGLREARWGGGGSGICGTVDIGDVIDAAIIEEVLQRCVSKENTRHYLRKQFG